MAGQTLILVSPPDMLDRAYATGLPVAVLAYRARKGFHLFRADMELTARGGLMMVDDVGLSGPGSPAVLVSEIIRECISRRFSGVVLDFSSAQTSAGMEFASRMDSAAVRNRLRLYVPSNLGDAAPKARVMIGTALSGGTLQSHLEKAAAHFGAERIALELEFTRADFALPSPNGEGRPLAEKEFNALVQQYRSPSFFSQDLCAYYFTYRTAGKAHFVLYDNASSIRRKQLLAAKLGIQEGFLYYPETAELIPAITGA